MAHCIGVEYGLRYVRGQYRLTVNAAVRVAGNLLYTITKDYDLSMQDFENQYGIVPYMY